MNKVRAKQRIEKLKQTINHHRYLFHVLDRAEISDQVIDSLKHELKQLETEHPALITPDSPTQRVEGKPLEKFAKVAHKVKQWSLEDAFSQQEIIEWSNRLARFLGNASSIEFVGELKIDGLHVVLTYEKGVFVTGATRGDGEVGEDVTQNLKTIESIPLVLREPIDCVVEGEVFMRKSVLEELNRQRSSLGQPLLANPRNAAAGAIRQLDSRIAASRKLDSFMYEFVWPAQHTLPTQEESLEYLAHLGFKVNKEWRLLETIDQAVALWQEWEKKHEDKDFWIDGVVLKVNSKEFQRRLGFTGKSPRWAVAAKFSPEERTTIVTDIVPFVGRTGKLTPVAFLEPVLLKGTTVSRASLHNYDEVARLDVRKGDTVVVRKAGDVIPQITSVVKELRQAQTKPVRVPKQCPMCGSSVQQKKGEVDYYCSNRRCGVIRTKQIIYFASKAGLDIEGVGEKNIQRFIDEGLVEDILDLFDLQPSDIAPLPGFGEKSATKIVAAINKARQVPLWRLINALGIDYIGRQTSFWIQDWLLQKFGAIVNPNKLLAVWETLVPQDLAQIPGIGPKASESFINFIKVKHNRDMLEGLSKRGVGFIRPRYQAQPLAGKSFLFTGSLETMTRSKAEQKVLVQGGVIANSVSKSLDYLVAGKDPGSKFKKAQMLNVKQLSEQEFLTLLR